MPRYTIVVEWKDSGDVEDADEVVVYADSPALAVIKAKAKWRIAIGSVWPHCKLVRAFALTPKTRRELA